EHGEPVVLLEELRGIKEDAAAVAEVFDLESQRFRDLHRAGVAPKRLLPLLRVIVQDQEIPYPLILESAGAIEFLRQHRVAVAVWKQRQQPRDRRLDQVNRSRLQRLEKSRRQADGDAIARPELPPDPGGEAQRPRLAQGLTRQVGEQDGGSLVIAHVLAAVDMAVAHAMLQRNAPLP